MIKINVLNGGVYSLDIDTKLHLVIRNSQEVITEKELKSLLEINQAPRAYWGFECSG